MITITIGEIAKIANVSVATVSRVINKSGKVSPQAKEKIEQIVKEYGYHPNVLGRNLRTKETKMIMVMITSIANSFYSKVVDAIDKIARENGYNIMICVTNDNPKTESNYLDLIRNGFCDGAIIMNTTLNQEEMHDFISMYNVVQCNEYIDENSPYVAIDNKKAAYDAVTYLIKTGRKRIAYCGVVNHFRSSHLRWEGYVQALTDNGIEVDRSIVIDGNYGFRSATELTRTILKKGVEFDALFAISDRMAAGAMNALKEAGKKIPEDVAVMGFDNVHLSYMVTPAMSTVGQPQKKLGEEAFNMLMKKINNKPCEKIILPHEIVVRKST